MNAMRIRWFIRGVTGLLVAMGYGGSRQDAGRAIGRSGDGGIDGIIKEDRLGLDVIYLQAKRWEGTVGRPEVHKFAGKITTKMILIDGTQLASLMVDYNVGITRTGLYELKHIDADYFEGG